VTVFDAVYGGLVVADAPGEEGRRRDAPIPMDALEALAGVVIVKFPAHRGRSAEREVVFNETRDRRNGGKGKPQEDKGDKGYEIRRDELVVKPFALHEEHDGKNNECGADLEVREGDGLWSPFSSFLTLFLLSFSLMREVLYFAHFFVYCMRLIS
jgi:hypothetical protein